MSSTSSPARVPKMFVPEIVSKAKRNKPTQSQIKLNKVNKVLGFLEYFLGCELGDQQGIHS